MIVPRLYEDLSVLHQNTVPYHCYFIPTSNSAENTGAFSAAEDSDRAQMLSGCKWLFRYYPGSHCDCDYVRLDGEDIEFTVVSAGEETFSFNASLYTQEELESKRHNYELEECGDTVLCIDHRMAGIGSKSCGPDLSKEYRVDADHYKFAIIMKPERSLF